MQLASKRETQPSLPHEMQPALRYVLRPPQRPGKLLAPKNARLPGQSSRPVQRRGMQLAKHCAKRRPPRRGKQPMPRRQRKQPVPMLWKRLRRRCAWQLRRRHANSRLLWQPTRPGRQHETRHPPRRGKRPVPQRRQQLATMRGTGLPRQHGMRHPKPPARQPLLRRVLLLARVRRLSPWPLHPVRHAKRPGQQHAKRLARWHSFRPELLRETRRRLRREMRPAWRLVPWNRKQLGQRHARRHLPRRETLRRRLREKPIARRLVKRLRPRRRMLLAMSRGILLRPPHERQLAMPSAWPHPSRPMKLLATPRGKLPARPLPFRRKFPGRNRFASSARCCCRRARHLNPQPVWTGSVRQARWCLRSRRSSADNSRQPRSRPRRRPPERARQSKACACSATNCSYESNAPFRLTQRWGRARRGSMKLITPNAGLFGGFRFRF